MNIFLRDKIKEQGRTQRWISQKIGITETTLSRYISNKQNPSYKTAKKLALLLNCKPDDIFFNESTTSTINGDMSNV